MSFDSLTGADEVELGPWSVGLGVVTSAESADTGAAPFCPPSGAARPRTFERLMTNLQVDMAHVCRSAAGAISFWVKQQIKAQLTVSAELPVPFARGEYSYAQP